MQGHLQITYIGHATCLIESAAGALLTDPHFGRRCFATPRARPLAYDPGRLPALSAVCISHAHYDHCDIESFKYIPGRVPVIVPPGMGSLLHKFINNPIVELTHWIPYQAAPGITITPVPIRHIGGRGIPYLRYRHTSGYVFTIDGQQVYFAGDTGYGTHFREVGHMYPIDIALLPVGRMLPWLPFGRTQHLNGLEALQAFCDLKARHGIPIHWGSFGSGNQGRTLAEQLRHHAAERQLGDRMHIVEPEATWEMTENAKT